MQYFGAVVYYHHWGFLSLAVLLHVKVESSLGSTTVEIKVGLPFISQTRMFSCGREGEEGLREVSVSANNGM